MKLSGRKVFAFLSVEIILAIALIGAFIVQFPGVLIFACWDITLLFLNAGVFIRFQVFEKVTHMQIFNTLPGMTGSLIDKIREENDQEI